MDLNSQKSLENKNEKRSWIISIVIHIALLFIIFIPFLHTFPKDQTDEGILIAFGDTQSGQTDVPETATDIPVQEASASSSASKNAESIASENTVAEAPVTAADKKRKTTKPVTSPSTATPQKSDTEAERRKEQQRREELKKAEEENAQKQKKKFSDLFGKGQGSNNTSGQQGESSGDPGKTALEGISKGTGKIGGGLSGRGIMYTPEFNDNSQKTGRVALQICVNSEGQVTQADFTQRGSTTSDAYLIQIARQTALKYKFSKGEVDQQCGTLTIDFKVQ